MHMQVLKAVVLDLAEFAIDSIANVVRMLLPARQRPLALPGVRLSPHALLAGKEAHADHMADGLHCYIGESDCCLYTHPTVIFDGAQKRLLYGDRVAVHRYEGRFASVTAGADSGWVLKDVLFREVDDVLPRLVVGAIYDCDHRETMKLRKAIGDEFLGAAVHAPLTSVEYVTYRLMRAGKRFPWGTIRPRTPGSWQRLLKGAAGVHSGVSPKTGSVMEYHGSEADVLAYVDAVAPDETIRISMISDDDNARYLEQELTKDSWRELRPVFISAA